MLLFVTVPLDGDGKPELQLPAEIRVDREPWGAWITWRDEALCMYHLGLFGGGSKRAFACDGTGDVARYLVHLGADVRRARDLVPTLTLAQREWLRDRGVRGLFVNGTIRSLVIPHCRAGNTPLGKAMGDYQPADGDVVTVEALAA